MGVKIKKKYFGTDGIRGRVGKYPINAEFVLKLGWAIGRVFSERQGSLKSKIIIGKDTRVSGYMFESALEAGLSAAGMDCLLLGPMPTPAIAYLTRTLRAEAGIVISASHNSFEDNGIKIFSSKGFKLPDEIEHAIEEEIEKPMITVDSVKLGKAKRVADATGRYIEFCKSTIASDVSLNGLSIVVDCAHGATYHSAPAVLTELGADIVAIGIHPDGFNINKDCGSIHIEHLREKVLEMGADLGIAFDGDGDRVIMVDHQGEVVDGDDLVYIMAMERVRCHTIHGGVVGTQMTNLGVELAIRNKGLDFIRTPVGDRYVLAELLNKNWILGGESSGHIINLDLNTSGDGIISALQVLKAICKNGKSLQEMKREITKLPQKMLNIRVIGEANPLLCPTVTQTIANAEEKLGLRGRILVRAPGTEPVIRVMVEGEDKQQVETLVQELAEAIQRAI